jgi:methionyl-tRNA synthetase
MKKRIDRVIENIIQMSELVSDYLDEDDPWKVILDAKAIVVMKNCGLRVILGHAQFIMNREFMKQKR